MHPPDQTIAALATPPGEGALALIRVSGPAALASLLALLPASQRARRFVPRMQVLVRLRDARGVPLDEALAAWFPAPRSYSGEDSVEICTHGGPATVRALLGALYAQGVRAAAPGEFTYRAFLNGRLDLMQAEAVAELIHSRGESERRLALNQLEGSLGRRVAPLRERLLRLLRDVEAGIDFGEEDIEFVGAAEIAATLDELRADFEALIASAEDGLLVREGVSLVIAGAPNVGKSSLFNALLRSERAIVTDQPGTTRDLLSESWLEGGLRFHLQDTAGLRAGTDRAEELGVERSREALARAHFTLWVCDGSRFPTAAECAQLAARDETRTLLLLNKLDLPTFDDAPYRHLASGTRCLALSARDGRGLDTLRATLLDLALGGRGQEALELDFAVNRRQEARLAAATAALDLGPEWAGDLEPELLARRLRDALAALDELEGREVGERVLAEIFSSFCIGK